VGHFLAGAQSPNSKQKKDTSSSNFLNLKKPPREKGEKGRGLRNYEGIDAMSFLRGGVSQLRVLKVKWGKNCASGRPTSEYFVLISSEQKSSWGEGGDRIEGDRGEGRKNSSGSGKGGTLLPRTACGTNF